MSIQNKSFDEIISSDIYISQKDKLISILSDDICKEFTIKLSSILKEDLVDIDIYDFMLFFLLSFQDIEEADFTDRIAEIADSFYYKTPRKDMIICLYMIARLTVNFTNTKRTTV
jgi:hypothetical protein